MTPSILLTQSIPTSRTTLEDPWSCTSTRISSNSWILFHGRRYISSILTTQDTVHLNGSIDTAACISWLGDITGLSKRGLMGLVLDIGSSATSFGGSLMVSTWARSGTWTGCTCARVCSSTGCLGLAPSFSVSTVFVEVTFNSWYWGDLNLSALCGSVDGLWTDCVGAECDSVAWWLDLAPESFTVPRGLFTVTRWSEGSASFSPQLEFVGSFLFSSHLVSGVETRGETIIVVGSPAVWYWFTLLSSWSRILATPAFINWSWTEFPSVSRRSQDEPSDVLQMNNLPSPGSSNVVNTSTASELHTLSPSGGSIPFRPTWWTNPSPETLFSSSMSLLAHS